MGSDQGRLPTRSGYWRHALLVALGAAAAWWVWMGWDTSYRIDPATGSATGPYEAWQVAGGVITLLVVGVIGARTLPLWVLVPAVVVPFVCSWAVSAQALADSSLWLVGLVLLTAGVTAAAVVVGLLGRWFWRSVPGRVAHR